MKEQMSGPKRFGRFAGEVCLKKKYAAGLISEEDFNEFQACLREDIEPSVELINRCLPNAVKSYFKYCEAKGIKADWSYESVGDYWLNGHGEKQGHIGECATRTVVVLSIRDGIISAGLKSPLSNPYNLELEPLMEAVIHYWQIVEIAED